MPDSHVKLRLRAEVHGQLQGDAHVVLHAAHLPVERDALLAESVCRGLVLEGVDAELLAHAAARALGVLRDERVEHVHAVVAQHVVEERHHGELDLLHRTHIVRDSDHANTYLCSNARSCSPLLS